MITVLGKLKDVEKYRNMPDYNVFTGEYSWLRLVKWLDEAKTRGDKFLLVSSDFSGVYAKEVRYLLGEL